MTKSSASFGYRMEDNILLEKYKTIYFPIPKVASSSLKVLFSDSLGLIPPDPDKPAKAAHKRVFPYAEREMIASDYSDYLRFAVVRNPFTRILSCFRDKIRKDSPLYVDGVAKHLLKYKKFNGNMTFHEFLQVVANIPDDRADRHFRSQYKYICDANGILLTNCIVKFENMSAGLSSVFDKIGLDQKALPHLLKTGTSNDYREAFSKEDIELVQTRYAKDFELFGYTF